MRFKAKVVLTSEDAIHWKLHRIDYLSSTHNLATLQKYEDGATFLSDKDILNLGINQDSIFTLDKGCDILNRKRICKSCDKEFRGAYKMEYCPRCTLEIKQFYDLLRQSKNPEAIIGND